MNEFSWEEFFERFVKNYEEFLFYLKDKRIDISTGGYKSCVYLSYGNDKQGYIWKDYNSPQDFLNDKIFEGKTFYEIWSKLE